MTKKYQIWSKYASNAKKTSIFCRNERQCQMMIFIEFNRNDNQIEQKLWHARPVPGWTNSIAVSKNVDFRPVPFFVELAFHGKNVFSNLLAALFPILGGQD